MMKGKLLTLVILISVLSLVTTMNNAQANEERPTVGTPSNDEFRGETANFKTNSSNYIKRAKSTITNHGNYLTLYGLTESNYTVQTIRANVMLQRWNASTGRWENTSFVRSFTNNWSTSVSGSFNVNPAKGYYYRTRTYHWVSPGEGFYTESTYIKYD